MIWLKTTRACKVAIQRNMQSKNIVIISFIDIYEKVMIGYIQVLWS